MSSDSTSENLNVRSLKDAARIERQPSFDPEPGCFCPGLKRFILSRSSLLKLKLRGLSHIKATKQKHIKAANPEDLPKNRTAARRTAVTPPVLSLQTQPPSNFSLEAADTPCSMPESPQLLYMAETELVMGGPKAREILRKLPESFLEKSCIADVNRRCKAWWYDQIYRCWDPNHLHKHICSFYSLFGQDEGELRSWTFSEGTRLHDERMKELSRTGSLERYLEDIADLAPNEVVTGRLAPDCWFEQQRKKVELKKQHRRDVFRGDLTSLKKELTREKRQVFVRRVSSRIHDKFQVNSLS